MIRIATHPDRDLWDRYVAANGAATFAHRYAWTECLAATYGLDLFRLVAIDQETPRVSGILPLLLFNPPGREIRLISIPYTDSAGMLADDWQSGRQLLLAAMTLAESVGANHLELRQGEALQTFFQQYKTTHPWQYTLHNFKTGLRRPLPTAVDLLWSTLSAKVRNQLRKAWRCGCIAVAGGSDLLEDFYAVFSENMRDLGSPVHAQELFRAILDNTSLTAATIVIYLHEQPAAAAVVLEHNETLYNPWAASLRRLRPSCPNMLLYWSMLEYAVEHRCRWFDFGRSTPNAPTCRFKVQWGAEREPLGWHVFSRKPHHWLPTSESLEYRDWKALDLTQSRQDGPAIRRWISL